MPCSEADIITAVDQNFAEQIECTKRLTRCASTRGNESGAQDVIEAELKARGYEIDRWALKVDELRGLPGFSPVTVSYENAENVVGLHHSQTNKGKSLILNGHVDVVPAGPLDMWETPPFDPVVKGKWLYGRGGGDMKAGVIANLFALDALRTCGVAPAADVCFQSVIEEECTGNGALACLHRGYRADAVLIPEPFDEELVTAQVGVIWFQLHLRGKPTHVAYAGAGANAIEAAIPFIDALHALETAWNAPERRHPAFANVEHPINLNIGRIEGGDWTSSVPAWCTLDVRIGIYPGQDIKDAQAEIEATVQLAAKENGYGSTDGPKIVYHGLLADGYALADTESRIGQQAIQALEAAHSRANDRKLEQAPITATTDARFFGLYSDMPTLVYGPKAEAIHGVNERVDLDSLKQVTQSIALFIANWCQLEPLR